MPNDAKLGLLAGVVGVVLAAVLSNRSQPTPMAADSPAQNTSPAPAAAKPTPAGHEVAPVHSATPDYPASEPAPPSTPPPAPVTAAVKAVGPKTVAALPAEFPSTPVLQPRPEFNATPASRTRDGDLD